MKPLEGVRRIVLIRLSSLGDVLLTTALLRQLRKRFPEAELVAVVRQPYGELLRYNPRLNRLIECTCTGGFWQQWREGRELRRGLAAPHRELLIVDLQRNLRSWALRCGPRAGLLRTPKERLRKLLLVYAKRWGWWRLPSVPERYHRAVAVLQVEDDGEGLELWLPEEQRQPQYPPLGRVHARELRRIALAPGARHATKRWTEEGFIALGRALVRQGGQVVLIGSSQERELCKRIAEGVGEGAELCCPDSVLDAARCLDRCDAVVSNDSGLVHVAAARRVPVVVLYGSTVPELGFAPFRVPAVVVQYPLPCRPCTHIGRERCPLGHFACMRQIQPHHVLHALQVLQERLQAP
jgi:ADP-heptose:LPS heptosyltransferase